MGIKVHGRIIHQWNPHIRHRFTLGFVLLWCCITGSVFSEVTGNTLLIPMDSTQTNHLKAYGLVYQALSKGHSAEWLLNYKGGSFLLPDHAEYRDRSLILNISVKPVTQAERLEIYQTVATGNMLKMDLEKSPKIAVYVPTSEQPWDDAVRLVLEYAEIPYDTLWDKEVIQGALKKYDWLHLHHEDFTGQHGKFMSFYQFTNWYQGMVQSNEAMRKQLGYPSVQALKADVSKSIQHFVTQGGFLFAMCSATETIEIALAADEIPIVPPEIGGIPVDESCNEHLYFGNTFAFTDFHLSLDAFTPQFSDINIDVDAMKINETTDYFRLLDFSAKDEPIPTILCQNHVSVIHGFLGQTTAFHPEAIKPGVVILGINPEKQYVKYLHREYGKGFYTFYGGHDPEDFQHMLHDPPTNLVRFPNSPGYRLILNNILFPSTKKKKQKT